MKSIILYTATTKPVSDLELYTQVGPIWIRHEIFDGDIGDALDAATPETGEVVSNSHPLPDPVRYRFLDKDDVQKEGDEWWDDSEYAWVASPLDLGKPPERAIPHRRPLKTYEDAY